MTADRDFASAYEGYNVEWTEGHNSPQEYSVHGWAKATGDLSGSHLIFRLTINKGTALGDAQALGDRALYVDIGADKLEGATYAYDIQGQSLQKSVSDSF